MAKRILSIVAGIMASFVAIMLVEFLGHMLYPMTGVDMNNREAVKAMMQNAPLGALMMVLLGYVLGSFTGGLVAAAIADRPYKMRQAIMVGGVLFVGGIMNIIMLPHPMWFLILSLLVYLPFAYLGGRVASGKPDSAV